MPAAFPEDWQRLASYVVSARVTAGFKDRRSLAHATGITERTLGTLENGRRVSPETLAVVEKAIGWKPDSARQVLRGGEPEPVDGDDSQMSAALASLPASVRDPISRVPDREMRNALILAALVVEQTRSPQNGKQSA